MKWKTGKETINIECIELGSLTFDEERMGVSFEIFDMSDELKAKVDKAVEMEKVQYAESHEKMESKYAGIAGNTVRWSDKPVVIDYNYLYIVFEDGRPISYSIIVGFHDTENEQLETCAEIGVDLSEYANKLKIQVIKVLLEKFFWMTGKDGNENV